ncbi:MAG TPA: type II secretion system F family protein [Acidimicrobiia bacterium]|nr:type II secretion system F family protein [Acidimicrobiia bacterium]
MPTYRYVAVGPDGNEIKEKLEAASEDALRNQLLLRNLEVKQVKVKKTFNEIELSPQRVPRQEIMHFSRQMAAFVRTGIPITEALEVVEDGSANKRFRQIVATMREQINNGVPFSDAIAEHARVFPPYYIGILRSAEQTGRLDTALEQLAGYIERDLEAKSKIKAAMVYPMVILATSILTVVILAVWVMPKFVVFFKNLQAKLPLPTRLLINLSAAAQTFWYVWAALLVGCIAVLVWMHRSARGRLLRDRMFLRVPLVKDVVLFAVTERVCRIVGAMVKAGVPLPETLNAAIQGANNQVFEEGLATARERMLEGEGLALPIQDTHLFPRAASQMMRVGEETGTLDIQLENAAAYYGQELEYKLKRLTSLFEPAVIIFMGLIVGFVAIALISAMYGIFNSSKLLNTAPKK